MPNYLIKVNLCPLHKKWNNLECENCIEYKMSNYIIFVDFKEEYDRTDRKHYTPVAESSHKMLEIKMKPQSVINKLL